MLRIESHATFINAAARRGEPVAVNGVPFRALDGRVLSDPVTETQVGMFDGVDGFALVRADPPYEIVKALTPAAPLFLTSTEGEPATSEADPGATASAAAPAPEIEPEGEPDEADGLDALTKAELAERLADAGRTVGTRATRADMIALLRGLADEPE